MKIEISIEHSSINIQLDKVLADPTELNRALGKRLERDLRDHFIAKNAKPNKLGGQRENFWSGVAKATVLKSADKSGAVVVIGKREYRVHFYGGVIKPVKAKALTIPLVKEAKGLRTDTYEKQFGVQLFSIRGRNVLFAKSTRGLPATESLIRSTRGKTRTGTSMFAPRVSLRAVYALVKSVTIPRDPEAFPQADKITESFTEVVTDFFNDNDLIS